MVRKSMPLSNAGTRSVLLAVLLATSHACWAQVITTNDGFEGSPMQGTPPPGWQNCNDGLSTGDTQPGWFHNHVPASEGQTYLSLVTRALNPFATVETVWADLLSPLEQGVAYHMTIDLSLSSNFQGDFNWDTYYFNNPCVLRVIGFNGDCDAPAQSEILWESGIVDVFGWQTFDISFSPQSGNYQSIALRPYFTPVNNIKNSALLLDALKSVPSVDPGDNTVLIPNVFSPNGDGVNDVFSPEGVNILSVETEIHDRWGKSITVPTGRNGAWDGRRNGSDCSAGVYFYSMAITFKNGDTRAIHGCVSLLR